MKMTFSLYFEIDLGAVLPLIVKKEHPQKLSVQARGKRTLDQWHVKERLRTEQSLRFRAQYEGEDIADQRSIFIVHNMVARQPLSYGSIPS